MVVLESLLWLALIVPVLIVALALTGAGYGAYSLRKSIIYAAEAPCPRCGEVIGREAVMLAKQEFAEKIRRLREENPGVRFRIVAEWEIRCSSCGGTVFFSPQNNRIETRDQE